MANKSKTIRMSDFFVKVVNSPAKLTWLALSILFVATAGYALFEQKNLLESLWWALMTATTVGYGDTYPNSSGGKVIAVWLSLTTILFIVPMITASIASKLIVNRDAFTHEEQEEVKNMLRELLNRDKN